MDTKWKALGGSDMAAIMGVSPYQTEYDVWLRVTGQYQAPETPVLRRGKLFEPVFETIAREDLGLAVRPQGLIQWEVGGVPLRASLDAVADTADGGVEVVEYKTSTPFQRQAWGAECPGHYAIQVQWYLLATGAKRGHLIGLIGLDDVRHYVIEADPGLQKRLLSAAVAFWQRHVVGGVAPSAHESAHAAAYLAEKHPVSGPAMLPTDDAVEGLLGALVQAQADRKAAEEREEEIKTALKAKIGDNRGFAGITATVTWAKAADKQVVDWEAVATEGNVSPILVEKHTTTKPGSRIFRVTLKGEK